MGRHVFALSPKKAFIAFVEGLLHGDLRRISLPPGHTSAIACHCTAAIMKPHHRFASRSVFRAVFKRDCFGFFLVRPAVRVAIRSVFFAVGDGAVDFTTAAWAFIEAI
ncbi:protein of unknown function [Candidatus Methylomirabilis oxygeniifera]|uniref:Uncharacterized protein n=1 Tax=Methylomirabilis oxygeniifera TaxID=671143 RepID=D5MHZ9_METO1|nr:protein of unknown function [Candidatus Methylomirabilis oxyfera]